ncbi:MAG: cadherin-like beta sandwich domain-containing protein [Bacilli bacterium]|nr:cadherin-like beta sandwich domain-containing protein [Bacilli bacterium]
MKYLKYLLLISILFFPIKVKALISFDCSELVKPGNDIICNIKSDDNITYFEGTLNVDSRGVYFGSNPGTGFTSDSIKTDLKFKSTGGKDVATSFIHVPNTIKTNTIFKLNLSNIKYILKGAEKTQNTLNVEVSIGDATTKPITTTKPNTNDGTKTSGESLHLKTLNIEGQDISFSKFKFTYDLTVLYEVENLLITAEAASEDISVAIPEETTLEVGENEIIITLTNNEGESSVYTIKVKRLNEGEVIRELSTDATLKSVSFAPYKVDFSPNTFNYKIEIDSKTTEISVTAVPKSEYASYEVIGNTDLSDGSIIKIEVTAEDGTIINYDFHISVKQNIFEEYRLYIIIAGALILVLLIIVIIIKSNNKKKKNKAKSSKTPAKKEPTKTPGATPKKIAPSKPAMPKTPPTPEVEVLDL